MSEREEGFYWVSLYGGKPEIAKWENGVWWATGEGGHYEDDRCRVLSRPVQFQPTNDA